MRNAGLLLLPVAVVVAVITLWPDADGDRHAERSVGPVPAAAPPSRSERPSASTPTQIQRDLTVRFAGDADQPQSARVCVTDADKKLIKPVRRLRRGKSFELSVTGPVNVVGKAAGEP